MFFFIYNSGVLYTRVCFLGFCLISVCAKLWGYVYICFVGLCIYMLMGFSTYYYILSRLICLISVCGAMYICFVGLCIYVNGVLYIIGAYYIVPPTNLSICRPIFCRPADLKTCRPFFVDITFYNRILPILNLHEQELFVAYTIPEVYYVLVIDF